MINSYLVSFIYSANYLTAMGLEPTTIYFVNEHTII